MKEIFSVLIYTFSEFTFKRLHKQEDKHAKNSVSVENSVGHPVVISCFDNSIPGWISMKNEF